MWLQDACILRCAKPNSCINCRWGLILFNVGPGVLGANPVCSQQLLIQLLGFAQRKIRASRTHIPPKRRGRKAFPTTLKSFGDRLRLKRLEMSLAQPERGQREPNANEACRLESVLGLSVEPLRRSPTAE